MRRRAAAVFATVLAVVMAGTTIAGSATAATFS